MVAIWPHWHEQTGKGYGKVCRLFLLLAVAACTEPLPELPIAGSRQLEPVPIVYAEYWRQVEACSGLPRPAGVSFYVFDGRWFLSDGVGSVAAYQYIARRVTLARPQVDSVGTIRHEMLHAVLGPDFAGMHPPEYFVVKCGALVSH